MKKISLRKAKKLPEGQAIAFKLFGNVVSASIMQSEAKRKEVREKFNSSPLLKGAKWATLGITKLIGLELYTAEVIPVSFDEFLMGVRNGEDYLYGNSVSYQRPTKEKAETLDGNGHTFVRVV